MCRSHGKPLTPRPRRTGAVLLALVGWLSAPGTAHAVVNVGSDLHGFYDGCIARFTAAGLRDLVDQLDRSKHTFKFTRKDGTISNAENRTSAQDGTGTGGETYINPFDTSPVSGEAPGVRLDPCATLYHEMRHLADYDNGSTDSHECAGTGGISIKEVEATRAENRYRASQPDLKNHLRTAYGPGTHLPPDGQRCEPGASPPPRSGGGCNVSAVGLPTCGVSNGDPHLTTFDQLDYDFQAVGEFIAVKSTSRDDLEIQVRQRPLASAPDVSVNTAVAMNVAGDFVVVALTPGGTDLQINGKPRPLVALPISLAGRGELRRLDTDEISIMWPDGSQALLYQIGQYGFRLGVNLAPARRGKVHGLLGDFDGRPGNDLRLRNGAQPLKAPTFAELYPRFSDSWRITQAESLFRYAPGQSTRTFTDTRLPTRPISPAQLADSGRAQGACREAGVTDAKLLQDCTLDVALSGSNAFATSAADTQRVFLRKVRASQPAPPAGGSAVALVFGAPVSGTLRQADTDCTRLGSTQGFALHVNGALAGEKLELFVNLTGGYHGPGAYTVGSVSSHNGQASLSYRDGAYATDGGLPGKFQVNPDGRSGAISAELGAVSVTGTWSCATLDQ